MSEPVGSGMRAWLTGDPRRFDLAVAAITVAIGTLLVLASPDSSETGWPEWAAGIGAFVLLMLRRRWPMLLLAVALAWTAVHAAVLQRPTQMIFVVLVLVGTVCVRLNRWPAIALGSSIAISLYVLGLVSNEVELGDARAVIGIAWTAGAVGIADAIRSWRRYRESAEAQVRSAVLAADAQTRQQVAEERLTIARELHDLLAHNLSVMNVQTGAALHLLRTNPDKAEESLTSARDAGRTVLDELSELLAVLRHDEGETEPTSSLPTFDQIGTLVETMRSAGLDVKWRRSGSDRTLAPAVSLAAYRITQEALTNAAKHGTGTAELLTQWDEAGLLLRVSNASAMAPGPGGGHGLTGMRERATANGGRFSASHVEEQHVVEAWLPAAANVRISS